MKLTPIVMHESSHHIISRLTWDTAFAHQEQAVQLQERLSDWSGFHMQQEMALIFDKLCPPEQTWRIPRLELDLGTIEFDVLELELSAKFRQQLHEKLTELILYPHQRGRNIEILDVKKSHVQLIRHFLWHGLLPWNHPAADGSVNQILAAQLQHNREELIAMLKASGFSAEQVRRRMAWQFNEPNMLKIIEGFEPNVGSQIILFSNELTKIQQKETIVQAAGTGEFKKNLWLWVLNYLLTERGTVFNRIQFMKSSIIQMAAHYNMQYDQLFELIELSVAKLSSSLSLQPNFITTLKLLSKENKSHKKGSGSASEDTHDNWTALEVFFRDPNLRRAAGESAAFNDLVDSLSRQNSARFLELINSFENTSHFWLPLMNDLSDDTLKTLFSTLKAGQSVVLTESILFLDQLLGDVRVNRDRNLLWYKGLMMLLGHKDTSFDEREMLNLLTAVLAERKKLPKIAFLDQLMAAEVPSSLKTLLRADLHQQLTAVFMTEVSRMPALRFKKHIQQLMELLRRRINSRKKDQKRIDTLQNILENYVRLYPKAVQEAFLTTPYPSSLEPFLPSFITGKSTAQLKLASAGFQETRAFLEFLKKEITSEPQLIRLNEMVSLHELLKIMGKLHEPQQAMLNVLAQFGKVLGNITLNGLSAREMQFILFKKTIKAWKSGNWKLIAAENIWNELIWEACTKKAVSKTEFLRRMDLEQIRFPTAFRLPLNTLLCQDRASRNVDKGIALNQVSSKLQDQGDHFRGNISVRNAGLVLINGYLPMLLTRLELINEEKKFVSQDARLSAIHYLQYAVTGLDHTEESLLPLNKLLCGIPLSQPVIENIAISEAHKVLIEGLIEAVISHWTAIGKCSVNGFRGNWLVRDGLLGEKEDRWVLTVEKRAYDLLIHKSPFSFSVIKYPWMDKPLHVNWPY